MVTGVIIAVVAGGLFWLAYRPPRPRRWWLPRPAARLAPAGAAVDRQHRHLRAGGLIGEAAFESTRARFRDLLDSGRTAEVEGELRGGLAFAVQVRALAEIGTPQAAAVLERLLGRPLTRDRVEQSWYWADVAAALRALGRPTALPAVLRRADETAGLPQGVLLAAEAVGFPNFAALLRPPADPAAVRALARAARGCRDGTADPAALLRAGLGDHLAAVSESAPPSDDPWLTAAVLEAERVSRRLEHWARLLPAEVRPLAERQAQRLEVSAERRAGWLGGAARRLADRFPLAPAGERAAALAVLGELRADVAGLFPALPDRRAAWWADAVRALAWSRSAVVGPVLAVQATALLGGHPRGAPRAPVRGGRAGAARRFHHDRPGGAPGRGGVARVVGPVRPGRGADVPPNRTGGSGPRRAAGGDRGAGPARRPGGGRGVRRGARRRGTRDPPVGRAGRRGGRIDVAVARPAGRGRLVRPRHRAGRRGVARTAPRAPLRPARLIDCGRTHPRADNRYDRTG